MKLVTNKFKSGGLCEKQGCKSGDLMSAARPTGGIQAEIRFEKTQRFVGNVVQISLSHSACAHFMEHIFKNMKLIELVFVCNDSVECFGSLKDYLWTKSQTYVNSARYIPVSILPVL